MTTREHKLIRILKFTILGCVVAIALIKVGDHYWRKRLWNKIQQSITIHYPKNIPSENTPPTRLTIPKNWTTYKNEEYGFELEYPTDWIVYNNKYFQDKTSPYAYQWGIEPPTRPANYNRSPYFIVGIYNNLDKLSLFNFFQEFKEKSQGGEGGYFPYVDTKRITTITTKSGIADVFLLGGIIEIRKAYLAHNTYIFELYKPEDLSYTEIYTKEDLLKIYNRILSSVKFIK